ncbi:hypothetical protein GF412_01035 [Candidatus Micrarchaeota archaeon]|nr:hypothetical protein [Candidatus Micrarchaeota archaeon]MBD3417557.1 hypothetical protein [Candidatus Micrarchaeota archaeon]
MTEDKSVLIEYLGDTPIIRIIDFLLENRLFDYSKKQIIDETGLAKATFYKYWDRLVELEVVKVTRSFGKTKLYKLNEENPVVEKIKALELSLIEATVPATVKAKPA